MSRLEGTRRDQLRGAFEYMHTLPNPAGPTGSSGTSDVAGAHAADRPGPFITCTQRVRHERPNLCRHRFCSSSPSPSCLTPCNPRHIYDHSPQLAIPPTILHTPCASSARICTWFNHSHCPRDLRLVGWWLVRTRVDVRKGSAWGV